MEKDENGNWYRKDQTKTPAGERLIELGDVTIVVLENWRRNQVVNTDTDFIISRSSYLINVLKKDILYVVKCMGHADKSTTLNTYSHWFNALDKTVSEEITQNVISSGLDSILYQNSCQTTN
nr:hypothetical protein [Streptococcus pyogenes]